MSRSRARRKVTSSPSSRMRPEVGSSSPAIMRKVVVLPQPDGPSSTKNSPFPTVRFERFTAVKSPNALCRSSMRISAMSGYSGKWLTITNMTVPARMVTKE